MLFSMETPWPCEPNSYFLAKLPEVGGPAGSTELLLCGPLWTHALLCGPKGSTAAVHSGPTHAHLFRPGVNSKSNL